MTLSSPEKSIRKAAAQQIKRYIDFALNFNAVVAIGLVKGWIDSTSERSQFEDYLTESLEECNEYANDEGINLVLEPINRFQEDFSIPF